MAIPVSLSKCLTRKTDIAAAGDATNFPASRKNTFRVVSSAGTLGGGLAVVAGDILICITTTPAGTYSAVSAAWALLPKSVSGSSIPVPTGAVANQILIYDGTNWVPGDRAAVASAGGTNFFLTDSELQIEGMTRANPCVVTRTGHGMVDGGHQVKFEDITQAGWTALNSVSPAANLWFTATILSPDTFSIPVNTTGYAADYVPGTDAGTCAIGQILNTPDSTTTESTDSARSTGSVEALIDVYATPAALGMTSIPGGPWNFNTWAYADSTSDTNTIVIRVYKRSSTGTEAQLFSVETVDLGTSATLSRIPSIQPAFTILATDHLVLRYFAKSTRAGGLYRTISLVYNGTAHYSYVETPIVIAHNQLSGLNTGAYRHLPAATADSDFVVGEADDGSWVKKTLAETKAILFPAPGAIGETTPGTIRGLNVETFKTSSDDSPLTAIQCAGTVVSNYGMTDADCAIELPTAASGYSFVVVLPAVRARYFKLRAGANDKIYLLGIAGADNGYVGVDSGYATGSACSFFSFKASDGGFDWYAIPIFGVWVAS